MFILSSNSEEECLLVSIHGSSYSWDFTHTRTKKDASLVQALLFWFAQFTHAATFRNRSCLHLFTHAMAMLEYLEQRGPASQEEQEAPGREEVQTVPEMPDAPGWGASACPCSVMTTIYTTVLLPGMYTNVLNWIMHQNHSLCKYLLSLFNVLFIR